MAGDARAAIVNALLEAFVDAWNRHDAKSMVGTFAPDADLYNLHGRKQSGKDAIGKFFTKAFSASLGASQLGGVAPNVRFVGEAAAAVDLLANASGLKDPKGQPRPDRRLLVDGTAASNPNGGWWLVVVHLRFLPPDSDPKSGPEAAADDPS